jgi:hypothetical protein
LKTCEQVGIVAKICENLTSVTKMLVVVVFVKQKARIHHSQRFNTLLVVNIL